MFRESGLFLYDLARFFQHPSITRSPSKKGTVLASPRAGTVPFLAASTKKNESWTGAAKQGQTRLRSYLATFASVPVLLNLRTSTRLPRAAKHGATPMSGYLAIVQTWFPRSHVEADELWIRVNMDRLQPGLRSAWKLHLSCTPAQMDLLLDRALPTLADFKVPLKVISNLDSLEELNDGRFGLTQVGKAVTIYPEDEREAVRIAEALRGPMRGIEGPRVPTDTPFCPEAPIHFRFGPFDGRYEVDAMGQKRRLLHHPEQGDVWDTTSGGDAPPPSPRYLPQLETYDHVHFLRERFLIAGMLQLTAKGGTFLAIERTGEHRQKLLLKTAKRGTNSDRFGRDAIWAMERERHFLEHLVDVPGVPAVLETVHDGDEVAALVRPFLEGDTWWEIWTSASGRTPAVKARLQGLLRSLHDTLRGVHARGVVVRDLSPGNILDCEERAWLIDFELAHDVETKERSYRRGTAGFYNPEGERFRVPGPEDDHYALLALALMAHAGVHPAWLPKGLGSVTSNSVTPSQGTRKRESSTAGFPAGRSPGAAAALGEGGIASAMNPAFRTAWRRALDSHTEPERFHTAFAEVIESVTAQPETVPEPPAIDGLKEGFVAYLSAQLEALPPDCEDPDQLNVYSGLAGLLLLALEWAPKRFIAPESAGNWQIAGDALEAAAERVAHIPGLYFGAPGIGLALLSLGRWLDDVPLASAGSALVLRQVDTTVPDVCQGLAGQAAAALSAWKVTGNQAFRNVAVREGRRLMELAEPASEGALVWPWPEGPFGSLSGARLYGFGHGAAGVVHTLFRLYEATGEASFLEAAEQGLATLRQAARPVEHAEDAVYWTCSETDDQVWNAWCHGTPGILKALAKALHVRPNEGDQDLLRRGLRGMCAANNGGYCLCHGVASRLDAYADAGFLIGATNKEQQTYEEGPSKAAESLPSAMTERSTAGFPAGRSPGAEAHAFAQFAVFANADAQLLAGLDLFGLERARRPGVAGEEAGGLMTGAPGVVRTLLRYRGKLAGPWGDLLL